MATEAHVGAKLETPQIDTRAVLVAACASLALVVGAVAGLHAVYRAYVPNPSPPPPQSFPEPQVRPGEAQQLRRLLAEQRARLTGYAWVDRRNGLVQVPIDRAMQLLVQKGAHAWDPLLPPAPALTGPGAGAQRAVTSGQGAPSGAAAPPAPGPGGAAPSDPNGEAKP
jgi:hypothetical protein